MAPGRVSGQIVGAAVGPSSTSRILGCAPLRVALFALVTCFGTGAVSAEPPAGEGWALVIGIHAVRALPPPQLCSPRRPGCGRDPARGGISDKNIRILLDRDASRQRIEQVLYRDLTAMKPDDRLLVYFAGHGATHPLREGEEGFFLPVDADPEALPATAISMQSVRQITQRLRGKQYFFVMDACFSGFALTRDREKPKPGELAEKFLEQPVIQVLTAALTRREGDRDGRPRDFYSRLLEGLRGAADTDRKGFVTGVELAGWIETRVLQDSDGKMTPQYGRLDGEGQFVFFFPGGPGEHLPVSAPSIKARCPVRGACSSGRRWRSLRSGSTTAVWARCLPARRSSSTIYRKERTACGL